MFSHTCGKVQWKSYREGLLKKRHAETMRDR